MKTLMAWLVAAALLPAGPASAAPAKVPVDVGTEALAKMSAPDRERAVALGLKRGADPKDLALLLKKGYDWDDAADAAALAGAWGLELPQVTAAHEAGHTWAELAEGAKLAAASGFSFGTVLAMRESGQSWEQVAAQVNVAGVDFRDAPRDPAPAKKRAGPKKKAKVTVIPAPNSPSAGRRAAGP